MSPHISSKPIIKPFALIMLTSLALMGCQPNSEKADSTDQKTESVAASETPSQPTTPAETDPVSASAAQSIEQPFTILALGDSLTEGLGVPENEAYPAQLQAALQQAGYVNAKVINSGLSGETSTGLVNRLDWC